MAWTVHGEAFRCPVIGAKVFVDFSRVSRTSVGALITNVTTTTALYAKTVTAVRATGTTSTDATPDITKRTCGSLPINGPSIAIARVSGDTLPTALHGPVKRGRKAGAPGSLSRGCCSTSTSALRCSNGLFMFAKRSRTRPACKSFGIGS